MRRQVKAAIIAGLGLWSFFTVSAATVLLPQGRGAFLCRELVEIAIAELAAGETAELTLAAEGVQTWRLPVTGDGGTVLLTLPPNALAPGDYTLALNGEAGPKLTIRRGLHSSTMFVSQTGAKPGSGANFTVGNAFTFGRLDREGQPALDLSRLSSGMAHWEKIAASDLPGVVYMYWTGYVTHKPWGSNKEWCSEDMTENMRLFNLHVAQRMRRYRESILYIGSLDEPGLPWGKTPAGGAASGFPNWNTKPWYEARGWTYTNDPASRPDADWMRYLKIRTGMIHDQCQQAHDDIKSVWPDAVYATDLYAPHAMMDGTDPWNQRCNDLPSTHVFVDWGYGKLGGMSGLYLEKAHDPTAKVAHAMNGQLFGTKVPQPAMRHAYHLMLNSLLAAGLYGNWWLNYGGMKSEDLKAVNEPAERLGPVFAAMSPAKHDVAVLWSYTEIGMRLKEITAREAVKPSGEQIKLMISEFPETKDVDGGLAINAYSVGGNYKYQVLGVHQALSRAGYPAHIIHENLLEKGILSQYRVLVLVGQTHPLPIAAQAAIDDFVASGGKLITDETTTAKVGSAAVVQTGLRDFGYRWGARFSQMEPNDPKRPVKDGYYQTNFYADSLARDAVPALREALGRTTARQVMESDSPWLAAERHVAGQGQLIMIINTYEELGPKDDKGLYYVYNSAPLTADFRLPGVHGGDCVYAFEGLDWKQVTRLDDPDEVQHATFEPGEMKLYLVTPGKPTGLAVTAALADGSLTVNALMKARLMGLFSRALRSPWPLEVQVVSPAGETVAHAWRSVDAHGQYSERISLGGNALPGDYQVRVSTLAGDLQASATVTVGDPAPTARTEPPVRVFDGEAIKAFLQTRPSFVIPYPDEVRRQIAEKLAAELGQAGIAAEARPEREVWRKALYPRVWDPYLKVYKPTGELAPVPTDQSVRNRLIVESEFYDTPTVTQLDGTPYDGSWRDPGTVLKVGPRGFVDISGPERFFEPGCQLLINDKRRMSVLLGEPTEVESTPDVRSAWARPWLRLSSYNGAFNLVPELPEAYACDQHLILFGDGDDGQLIRALQASELLLETVSEQYPGPGKALVQFARSPFALERNVIHLGATDAAGREAAVQALAALAR